MALVVGHIAHHFGVYTHHGGTPVAVVGLVAHEHNTLAPRLSEVPVEPIALPGVVSESYECTFDAYHSAGK